MLHREPLLVMLVRMVDVVPWPATGRRRRGRPVTYTERLIVKALVIMIIRRLYTAYSLLAFLEQETELTCQLRELLTQDGRFPTRRTWERRLARLPQRLPNLIGCLGRYLVVLLNPWAQTGRAAVLDSTALCAKGGVWHKKDRLRNVVPHSTIDTEAHWSKSGYHGWWYGWKLHLATTVSALWIPLAAELTPANVPDAHTALTLLPQLPAEVRFVLADQLYNDPLLRTACEQQDCCLVATRRGAYPHADDGAPVRSLFHRLRSQAIEPFNALFKNIFDWSGQVPIKGLNRTRLFVLGAVFLYQLVLLYQYQHHRPLGVGIKPLLRAA